MSNFSVVPFSGVGPQVPSTATTWVKGTVSGGRAFKEGGVPTSHAQQKSVTTFKEFVKIYSRNPELKQAIKAVKAELALLDKNDPIRDVYGTFMKTFHEKQRVGSGVVLSQRSVSSSSNPSVEDAFKSVMKEALNEVTKEVSIDIERTKELKVEHKIGDTTVTETCNRHEIDKTVFKHEDIRHVGLKGFLGSGDIRALFRRSETGLADKEALQEIPPVRVNARTHSVQVGGDTLSIDRGGAITDFRNTGTNLRKLREAGDETEFKERQKYLDELMLQRIDNLVKDAKFDGKPLLLAQISLLEEKVDKSKPGSAFQHTEKNFMLDMAEAFDSVHGAQVVFDGVEGSKPEIKRTEIDGKETVTVHFPKGYHGKSIPSGGGRVPICSVLFDISVQPNADNTKEGSLSKEMNDKAFGRLAEYQNRVKRTDMSTDDIEKRLAPPKGVKKVGEILKLSSNANEVAADLGLFIKDIGGQNSSIGVNCFSGKDRTGLVVATMIRKFVGNKLADQKNVENEMAKSLFGKESITKKIAQENVGQKVLKLKLLNISGVSVAQRVSMIIKAIKSAA